jgi:RNA polymerase sigma-70 factor, ECF subfamily
MEIDFDREDISELLQRWNGGDERARNALFKRLYAKMLAAAQAAENTAASMVHDAFVRFSSRDQLAFRDRTHFAGAWALTMRNLLVDRYRRQDVRHPFPGIDELPSEAALTESAVGRIDVVQALVDLAADEKGREAADAITLKVCGGLDVREIAALTGRSEATVGRLLRFARFFLRTRLLEEPPQAMS